MINLTPEQLREIALNAGIPIDSYEEIRIDTNGYEDVDIFNYFRRTAIGAIEFADARHLPQMIDYANTKVLKERARNKIVVDALVAALESSVKVLRKVPFIEVPASADTTVNDVVEMLDAAIKLARGEK